MPAGTIVGYFVRNRGGMRVAVDLTPLSANEVTTARIPLGREGRVGGKVRGALVCTVARDPSTNGGVGTWCVVPLDLSTCPMMAQLYGNQDLSTQVASLSRPATSASAVTPAVAAVDGLTVPAAGDVNQPPMHLLPPLAVEPIPLHASVVNGADPALLKQGQLVECEVVMDLAKGRAPIYADRITPVSSSSSATPYLANKRCVVAPGMIVRYDLLKGVAELAVDQKDLDASGTAAAASTFIDPSAPAAPRITITVKAEPRLMCSSQRYTSFAKWVNGDEPTTSSASGAAVEPKTGDSFECLVLVESKVAVPLRPIAKAVSKVPSLAATLSLGADSAAATGGRQAKATKGRGGAGAETAVPEGGSRWFSTPVNESVMEQNKKALSTMARGPESGNKSFPEGWRPLPSPDVLATLPYARLLH